MVGIEALVGNDLHLACLVLGLDVDLVCRDRHLGRCLVLVGLLVGPLVDLLVDLLVGLLVGLVVGHRFLLDLVDHDFLLHFDTDYFDHFLFDDFYENRSMLRLRSRH